MRDEWGYSFDQCTTMCIAMGYERCSAIGCALLNAVLVEWVDGWLDGWMGRWVDGLMGSDGDGCSRRGSRFITRQASVVGTYVVVVVVVVLLLLLLVLAVMVEWIEGVWAGTGSEPRC